MRFEQGAVEQVVRAVSGGMVFYNLLRHIVEYFIHIYKFNRMLVRWLNYREIDERVRKQIHNLQATLFLCNSQEVENQLKEEIRTTEPSNNVKNDWIAAGRVF